MNLLDYFQAPGRTFSRDSADVQSVAASAGIAPSTMYMAALGHKLLGHKAARRVEEATGGDVTVHDLRPDIFGAPVPGQPEQQVA